MQINDRNRNRKIIHRKKKSSAGQYLNKEGTTYEPGSLHDFFLVH